MTDNAKNIISWPEAYRAWVITEGIAGTENQCIGIAESLGVEYEVKRIRLRFPWRLLTPFLKWGQQWAISKKGDSIHAPYPDLIICAGRKAIPAALKIKQESGGRAFIIFLQHPRCDLRLFDMVVMPRHDWKKAEGDKPENVILTEGALNRVTAESLAIEAKNQKNRFMGLPDKKLAVLIGGKSKNHDFTIKDAHHLSDTLMRILKDYPDIALLVTASRRTGADSFHYLQEKLAQQPRVFFWDGQSQPNPYFAYLGLADWILATNDSISMMSEALSSGKPLYLWPLRGSSHKFNRFYQRIFDQGYARLFEGKLESWEYQRWQDTQTVAKQCAKEIEKHLKTLY